MASLAFFFGFLPLTSACLVLRTFEKFPESQSAKSARFFQAGRGVPGIPTRWPCATQPGLPPLRDQFRFGVTTEWFSVFVSRSR